MSSIPVHTRRLCERALEAYCARICPPTARHAVSIGYQIDRDCVTLLEWRPICGIAGTRRSIAVAQLRWSFARNDWRLYHRDSLQHWRRSTRQPTSGSFIDLLREVDADRSGAFWGRIDGKSLRWCSSKGRCEECDRRYGRALGLEHWPVSAIGRL